MDWVWSLWGWIWPAAFNVDKFKVDLKTGIIRVNLHKLKLQERIQREKSEVLEVIRNNKSDEAVRIKVESVIQHYRKVCAHEIIVKYCESLLARIELLLNPGDTPSEVLSAVHSIAYASDRLNIQELNEVTVQLKAKYGYNIGNFQEESAAVWIDKKVIEALSDAPPSEALINKYLQEYYGKVDATQVGYPKFSFEEPPSYQEFPTQSQSQPLPYATPPATPNSSASFTPSYSPSPSSFTPPVPSAPAHVPVYGTPSTPTNELYPNLATPSYSSYPNFSASPYLSTSAAASPAPSPSFSPSYVDPSLLYSSPCTTFASAPFVSPPPENPEFTAHEATRSHLLNIATELKKRSAPEPKKKMAHGGIRKKENKTIKRRKSNPFQQGPSAENPVKLEFVPYDSSDEECANKHNKEQENFANTSTHESEENTSDLQARLEALKRGTK